MISKLKILVLFFVAAPAVASAVNCHSGSTQPTIALCQQQDQQRAQQQSIPQQASQQVINCHSGGTQPTIALCQQQDQQRAQQQSIPQQASQQVINCHSGGTQPTIALCQQQDSRAAAQKPPQTASQSSATSDALRLQENQNKLLNSVVEQATAAVRRKDYQGAANLINSLPPSLQETAKDGVFGGATPVDMLPYFMPIGRVANAGVKTVEFASGIARSSILLRNQLPHLLENEIKVANNVGFRVLQIGDTAFKKAANEGTLKFVILSDGALILGSKFKNGIEISHAVLSRGLDVISAGEVNIATHGAHTIGLDLVAHSGHYLRKVCTTQYFPAK
jgi:hypothetical protein